MSKNTLQDKLKASIQRPASSRTRTPVSKNAASTAAEQKPAAPAPAPATQPAPAAKSSQPKKPYFNDDRVWPD